jgi:hypothetical protein
MSVKYIERLLDLISDNKGEIALCVRSLIPGALLASFHEHCPKAQLTVSNMLRTKYPDGLLPTSPQLHSLNTKLFCNSDVNDNRDSSAFEELQSLQQYVIKGNRIKHLRVVFCPAHDTESNLMVEFD